MDNSFQHFHLLLLLLSNLQGWATSTEHPNGMFLRFYFGSEKDNYTDEKIGNAVQIVSKLDDRKPIVLYIHGFTESVESDSTQLVVNAYLRRNDHNVLVLDYRYISKPPYYQLAMSVSKVGTVLANTLNEMAIAGMDTAKLHIVGHSIGAHIAGHIGRKAIFKIPRITGLDPAGPFFNFLQVSLSPADAHFVDVVHTDSGIYGIARSLGTVDFYPNGGHRLQPGCPPDTALYTVEDFCSHQRSWKYYAESVTDETSFFAVKCSSLFHFSHGKCKKNEKLPMGYSTPRNATGNFYLVTSHETPFGMRYEGLIPPHKNRTLSTDVEDEIVDMTIHKP